MCSQYGYKINSNRKMFTIIIGTNNRHVTTYFIRNNTNFLYKICREKLMFILNTKKFIDLSYTF